MVEKLMVGVGKGSFNPGVELGHPRILEVFGAMPSGDATSQSEHLDAFAWYETDSLQKRSHSINHYVVIWPF